jgi:hypothetical protein
MWRRGRESNPRIEVLQTSALPLGYPAEWAPSVGARRRDVKKREPNARRDDATLCAFSRLARRAGAVLDLRPHVAGSRRQHELGRRRSHLPAKSEAKSACSDQPAMRRRPPLIGRGALRHSRATPHCKSPGASLFRRDAAFAPPSVRETGSSPAGRILPAPRRRIRNRLS